MYSSFRILNDPEIFRTDFDAYKFWDDASLLRTCRRCSVVHYIVGGGIRAFHSSHSSFMVLYQTLTALGYTYKLLYYLLL